MNKTKHSKTRPNHPVTPVKTRRYESIVIVGTENHDWPENRINKAMFMMQAIRRLKLYPKTHRKRVFLFDHEYPADLLDAFTKAVKKQKAKLRTMASNADLLAAIAKRQHTIKRLDIYAHGTVGYLLFGLQCDYALSTEFTHAQANELSHSPFAFGAEIYSYACRTGLGNPDIVQSDTDAAGKKLKPMTEASLAQHLADKTRCNTHAYLRRTDYGDTFGSKADRASWRHFYSEPWTMDRLKSVLDQPPFSQKRADALKNSIDRQKTISTSYPFDPNGALNDVTAAPTPIGVNANMELFKPSKQKWP